MPITIGIQVMLEAATRELFRPDVLCLNRNITRPSTDESRTGRIAKGLALCQHVAQDVRYCYRSR